MPLEVCDNSDVEPADEKEQIAISEWPSRNAAKTSELVRRNAVMECDFYFLKIIMYLLR